MPLPRLAPSDYLASVALLVSLVALWQTRDANSPSVSVTAVAERSYTICDRTSGDWILRGILRFNVSNTGGRTTTLERIVEHPNAKPLTVAFEADTKEFS